MAKTTVKKSSSTKKSSSKRGGLFSWETSYFGGIQKMVYDFPFIDVPHQIIFRHKTERFFNYFNEKVFKIFMLKVTEHGLETELIFDHKVIKERKSMFDKEDTTYLHISPSSVKSCVYRIIARDADISYLFEDEKVSSLLLSDSDIYIEIPLSDENKSQEEEEENVFRNSSKATDLMKGVKKWKQRCYGGGNVSNGEHKENLKFVKVPLSSAISYTSEQRKDAENLIRMLDVNYDKKHDKIDSLKCGKLSPQKIAEVPAGNMHIYHRVEEDQATKPFSVVILCDESGSMRGDLFRQQHSLVKTLYLTFSQIMPSEQIFIFGHTGPDTPDVYIYQDKINPGFEERFRNQVDRDLGENYDGPVIEAIYDRVRKQAPNDNILLVVISDGYPSGHKYGGDNAMKELHRIVEKCKRDSFVTVGIGLGDYPGVKELYKYTTVIKSDGRDLVKNVSKVINIAVKTEFQ